MQIAQDNATASPALGASLPATGSAARSPYYEYKVIRRNGAVVGFGRPLADDHVGGDVALRLAPGPRARLT